MFHFRHTIQRFTSRNDRDGFELDFSTLSRNVPLEANLVQQLHTFISQARRLPSLSQLVILPLFGDPIRQLYILLRVSRRNEKRETKSDHYLNEKCKYRMES